MNSEFNFHYDPESVHIVLEAAKGINKTRGVPIINLITWETTIEYGFEWDLYEKYASNEPIGYFLNQT